MEQAGAWHHAALRASAGDGVLLEDRFFLITAGPMTEGTGEFVAILAMGENEGFESGAAETVWMLSYVSNDNSNTAVVQSVTEEKTVRRRREVMFFFLFVFCRRLKLCGGKRLKENEGKRGRLKAARTWQDKKKEACLSKVEKERKG